ncbi:MAG: carboxypeptidase regulatory-like domain-containing protein [Candidatus Aureabacteria bacterium]|nr:carboxypeptidase regulatory-like domain-containing protein [Candidatus Auribacterota bacterium]
MKTWTIPAVLLVGILVVCSGVAAPTPSPSSSPALAPMEVEILSPLGNPIPRGKAILFSIQTGENAPPCGGYEELQTIEFSEGRLTKDLPAGLYRLEIRAEGWQGVAVEDVVLSAGETKKIPVRLEPGYTIAGRVTDGQGVPIAGAKIASSSRGKDRVSFWSDSPEGKTDSDGRFRFSSLAEGLYRVEVSRAGYVERSLEDTATGTEDLVVVLKKGLVIKGRLIGEAPALGLEARMELKKGWETFYKKAPFDSEGNFLISDLEPGSYDLRLEGDEYLSDWVRQVKAEPEPQARPVSIEVIKGAKVSGKVIDSRTGGIVEGAHIKLAREGATVTRYASRNSDTGEYTYSPLLPGAYQVQVSLDSFSESPLASKEIVLAAGQEMKGVDFQIDPGRKANVSGMTVDEDGHPVPEARVRIYSRPVGKDTTRMRMPGEPTKSDSSGDFTINAYVARETEYVLGAEKDGFAPARSEPLLLSPDRLTIAGVVLSLGSGATLEVEVSDAEGKSVPQALVELSKDYKRDDSRDDMIASFFREKKLADVRGFCRFEHLLPQAYAITAGKKGFAEYKEKVKLTPGETDRRIKVVLEKGRTVTVSVRNAAGDPVPGAKVRIAPETEGRFIFSLRSGEESETDAAGVCSMDNLPLGALQVSVSAEGYVSARPTKVAPDQVAVEIVLMAGGTIAGRVVAADGKPVKAMNARAQRRMRDPFDFNFDSLSSETVDLGAGRFKITGLKADTYSLTIDAPGMARKQIPDVEVTTGETTDIGEIKLEREAVITGRVVTGSGETAPGSRVSVKGGRDSRFRSAAASKDSGRFELKSLPAGNYTLVFNAHDYREKEIADVSISPGETKELSPVVLEEMTPAEKEESSRENHLVPSLGLSWGDSSPISNAGFPVGEVQAGSAAEKAGIRPGDTITKVNGKGFLEDPGAFFKGILGKPGTKLTLTVKRQAGGATDEVEITIPEWTYEELMRKMEER